MKVEICQICGKEIVTSVDPSKGETREQLTGCYVGTSIGKIPACRGKCSNRVFRNLKKIQNKEMF